MRCAIAALCLLAALEAARAAPPADLASAIDARIAGIERALDQWQFHEARAAAEQLSLEHPDLPAVQLAAGFVKFHQGEHSAAKDLVERAALAFGGKLDADPRLGLVRAAAAITAAYERSASEDGRVIVAYAPGADRVLVPDIIDTVQRTLEVVGEDLGHRPPHPITVEVLGGPEDLSAMTGLGVREIDTSGTIAVCKYGRLLLISPRVLLKGYSYLDTVSHELVHMLVAQKTHNQAPIWLHEALAKYEDSRWRSGEPLFRKGLSPLQQTHLVRALRANRLITFEQMHPSMALLPSAEDAELAFSEVYTVTEFLLSLRGTAGLRALLERIDQGHTDLEAIQEVFGLTEGRFVSAWTSWLRSQHFVELEGEATLPEDRDRGSREERALSRNRRVDLRDHFHLGQLLRARGRNRAAAAEFGEAFARARQRFAALWIIADKLGQVQALLGFEAEARASFEKSLEVNPEGLEAHFHLGLLLRKEDPYQAYLHLREACRLNPMDPRVRDALARVSANLAETRDEREDFAGLARKHGAALALVSGLKPAATVQPVEPPPAEKAAIRIVSRPWARVWLDFRDTGLTTPVYQLGVAPGRHVVGLAADCLAKPEVVVVFARPGEVTVVDRELCKVAE